MDTGIFDRVYIPKISRHPPLTPPSGASDRGARKNPEKFESKTAKITTKVPLKEPPIIKRII